MKIINFNKIKKHFIDNKKHFMKFFLSYPVMLGAGIITFNLNNLFLINFTDNENNFNSIPILSLMGFFTCLALFFYFKLKIKFNINNIYKTHLLVFTLFFFIIGFFALCPLYFIGKAYLFDTSNLLFYTLLPPGLMIHVYALIAYKYSKNKKRYIKNIFNFFEFFNNSYKNKI